MRTTTTMLAALLLGLTGACSTGEETRDEAIDDYIRGIPKLPVDEAGKQELSSTPTNAHCIQKTYRETRVYGEFNSGVFDTRKIWPGALVTGESVLRGELEEILLDRGPLTFSFSLENLASPPAATMEKPGLSQFRVLRNEILSGGVTGGTPADIRAELHTVYRQEDIAMALGGGAGFLGIAKFSSGYGFSRTDVRSRYLLTYFQRYYTIDVDPPRRPMDFLGRNVFLSDVEEAIGDSPPLYVSSVTYGRMAIFAIESVYGAEETKEAVSWSVGLFGIGGSQSKAEQYREILAKSKITVWVFGGSGEDGGKAVLGAEGMQEYVANGGDYGPESPGGVLSYELSYLADATDTKVSFTHEYADDTCDRDEGLLRATLTHMKVVDTGDENEIDPYGHVFVRYGGGEYTLFHKPRSEHIRLEDGEEWPENGIIGQQDIMITPGRGSTIEIVSDLVDYDSDGKDDTMGTETVSIDLLDGWNRSVQINNTGSGTYTVLYVELEGL